MSGGKSMAFYDLPPYFLIGRDMMLNYLIENQVANYLAKICFGSFGDEDLVNLYFCSKCNFVTSLIHGKQKKTPAV